MTSFPRIISLASAFPPYCYSQNDCLQYARDVSLGSNWAARSDLAERARQMERLFAATGVETHYSAVDLAEFYRRPRTTGERMVEYQTAAFALGRAPLAESLRRAAPRSAADVTDLFVVSCTGYSAPGLDIQVARDLGLPRDVRRATIGHMGCFGALVGLRQCIAAVRAHPSALAALLSIELSSLHVPPALDSGVLTQFALFGDAAAALLLGFDPSAEGPEVIDTYCAAEFEAAEQMAWTITDHGFIMDLSPRVPVTLRRTIAGVVGRLLDPYDLRVRDVAHWIVHPGGPSILEVIQAKLELSDEQMAPSWRVLREHGNCSSATVLLILEQLLRSGRTSSGEWGVMMAFGPGLTLETCLLRF